MRVATVTIALCFSLLSSVVIAAEPVHKPLYVGVLENIDMPGDKSLSATIHARVAFVKKDADWVAMDSNVLDQASLTTITSHYPKSVRWTVVFDGRNLGTVTSRNPDALQAYGDVGVQIITSPKKDIPQIKMFENNFYYTTQKALSRPLVLVSAPNFTDPDGWKPTSLSHSEMHRAIKAFRKHVPKAEHCDHPEEGPVLEVPYKDSFVNLIKAYRSNKGELVFGLVLDPSTNSCESFDDLNYYDYWFAITKSGVLRFLDTGLTPIDAVDLDRSGSSEWIFKSFSGEDTDGYELFYDDFSKSAQFSWSWH
jgi:hypothetical protein